MVNLVDEEIRLLFEQVPALDTCLTVVTSDHGEELHERGRFGHGLNLYNETLRIPLLIRWPSRRASTCSDPVSLVDVVPTIVAALGGEPTPAWQGTPLTELAGAAPRGASGEVLAHLHRHPGRHLEAIVGPRWKLVLAPELDRVELYDLASTAGEGQELAAAHPEVLAQLRRRLEEQVQELAGATEATALGVVDPEQVEQLRELGYLEPGS